MDMLVTGPPEIVEVGHSLERVKLTEKFAVFGSDVAGSITLARVPVTVNVYVPRLAYVMLACCVSTKNDFVIELNVKKDGAAIEAELKAYAAVKFSPALVSELFVVHVFDVLATP